MQGNTVKLRLRGVAVLLVSLVLLPATGFTDSAEKESAAALEKIAAGDHRSDANKARDRYRHPVETLVWLGLRPDMTVVELSPGGGGWYTEILAPYLRDQGTLYAAGHNPKSEVEYYRKGVARYAQKLAANPKLYDKVVITVLEPPDQLAIAPEGVADMVLTFRNLHNWMDDGDELETVLRAIYRALKSGGTFGLIEHRGDSKVPQDSTAESGYVNQDYAIALAEKVGFEFVSSTEINANPADGKDHPEGVWTLPPALALEDKDRDKYLAIGESDRMTLKFKKPGSS